MSLELCLKKSNCHMPKVSSLRTHEAFHFYNTTILPFQLIF